LILLQVEKNQWIPAFAGMTKLLGLFPPLNCSRRSTTKAWFRYGLPESASLVVASSRPKMAHFKRFGWPIQGPWRYP
jgi:hypothetical protein